MTRPRRRRLRRGLLAAVVLLHVVAIPWYRAPNPMPALVWGLPDWVAVALACYAAAAGLNAVAWWLAEVDDEGAS